MHGSDTEHVFTDGYVLVQAQPGNEASALAQSVTQVPGVVRAERVRGGYDVIAQIREPREPNRTSAAARAIRELDGVLRAHLLVSDSRQARMAKSDGEAA